MSSTSMAPRRAGSITRQRRIALALRILLAIVLLFFALFPVVWIFSASINPSNSLVNQDLIPPNASLENYRALLGNDRFPFFLWMGNSLKLAILTTVLGLIFTAMAAYAFSASASGDGAACCSRSCWCKSSPTSSTWWRSS
ncbi:MAG: hypothetical protein R2854_09270 [Caldilineaceae bacterium]